MPNLPILKTIRIVFKPILHVFSFALINIKNKNQLHVFNFHTTLPQFDFDAKGSREMITITATTALRADITAKS